MDALGQVHDVRNQVMHFDPDPITDDDMATLRALRFLRGLPAAGVYGNARTRQAPCRATPVVLLGNPFDMPVPGRTISTMDRTRDLTP